MNNVHYSGAKSFCQVPFRKSRVLARTKEQAGQTAIVQNEEKDVSEIFSRIACAFVVG